VGDWGFLTRDEIGGKEMEGVEGKVGFESASEG
jgi:hypothetical protein